jgi:hypothetical protein
VVGLLAALRVAPLSASPRFSGGGVSEPRERAQGSRRTPIAIADAHAGPVSCFDGGCGARRGGGRRRRFGSAAASAIECRGSGATWQPGLQSGVPLRRRRDRGRRERTKRSGRSGRRGERAGCRRATVQTKKNRPGALRELPRRSTEPTQPTKGEPRIPTRPSLFLPSPQATRAARSRSQRERCPATPQPVPAPYWPLGSSAVKPKPPSRVLPPWSG